MVMFGQVPGVDKDIVNVYDEEPMEELPEHLIHWQMEGELERPYSITSYHCGLMEL